MKKSLLLISSVLLLGVCAWAGTNPKHKLSRVQQYGIAIARAIRDGLRDPQSFRVSTVMVFDLGDVCIDGRAKNGMGGYEPLQAVAIGRGKYKGLHVVDEHNDYLFETYCGIRVEGEGKDVTEAVKEALKADRDRE